MADIELTDLASFGASKYIRANSGATALEFDALTSADVGLSNVDNTSDATKNAAAVTLTNKTISLTSNTLTGTTAEFNTALSDGNFATLAGTETLSGKSISLTTNTITGTTAEFNTALSDGNFATQAGTETLTNKTITAPTVSGLVLSDASIVFEGTTADAYETTLTVTDPTADRTVTIPDATTTLVGTDTTQTLTNKTLSSATFSGTQVGDKVEIGIACSDETTALTTGTAKATFRMPYAMTVTAVRASVTTAPTGATLIVDINDGGTTIMATNKLSIDVSEKTSTTAATAAAVTDTALADDAEITIDIDQVGSTIAGAGLKVWILGTRA